MKGNPIDGFRDLSSIVDREINVSSATLYRNELVVGADRQLLRFDGHLFKPFAPKVKVSKAPFVIQPSATFSLNENLYLFDFSLRWRVFDGAEWQEYSLPSELVARPFPGLPPRR